MDFCEFTWKEDQRCQCQFWMEMVYRSPKGDKKLTEKKIELIAVKAIYHQSSCCLPGPPIVDDIVLRFPEEQGPRQGWHHPQTRSRKPTVPPSQPPNPRFLLVSVNPMLREVKCSSSTPANPQLAYQLLCWSSLNNLWFVRKVWGLSPICQLLLSLWSRNPEEL
ncbi:uncharacterized protein Bfra_004748 [Botrytis fragariae]|uniref:Uncharacterized protein n=1 Tax=Botrytis fragariae TaxID=1964551 RepID=A0A8H6AW97_9HELO|nr:uncharacterized protein Bfra_004748 [Botrytis fragariae]KAF5874732.1 hypothetical protein Bfra_004748 [Botrytis fragariae]